MESRWGFVEKQLELSYKGVMSPESIAINEAWSAGPDHSKMKKKLAAPKSN